MAAQVLSGTGNVSYTNSTGQNVRLVINYLFVGANAGGTATMTFAGCAGISINQNQIFGKTLAYKMASGDTNVVSSMASNALTSQTGTSTIPLEIALANGDTFSINATNASKISYNIIIIPEAG